MSESAINVLSRYTAAFAQLHNAAVPDTDAVPDVQDPKQNLAASLARLSQVTTHFAYPACKSWSQSLNSCLPASFTSLPLHYV